jgi:hypothetical protein
MSNKPVSYIFLKLFINQIIKLIEIFNCVFDMRPRKLYYVFN